MLETKVKLHIYLPFEIQRGEDLLKKYFLKPSTNEFKSLIFIKKERREADKEDALLCLAYFESDHYMGYDETYDKIKYRLDEIFKLEKVQPAFQIYQVEKN